MLAVWGSLHTLAMVGVELSRSFDSRREITRLQYDVADLKRELAGLEAVVQHGDDLLYREQLARCLGFIYPDEVRYLVRIDGNEPIVSKSVCE